MNTDLFYLAMYHENVSDILFIQAMRVAIGIDPIPHADRTPKIKRTPKQWCIIPPVDARNEAQLYKLREVHAQLAAGILKHK